MNKLYSVLRQFRAYNKKKLKEAEKATILISADHSPNGSWFIKKDQKIVVSLVRQMNDPKVGIFEF